MKIETYGDDAEFLALADTVKFVLTQKQSNQTVTLGNNVNHVALIPEGATFIGAGTFYVRDPDDHKAYWGSDSCKKGYKYDRPKDPSEAARVIDEVRETIAEWRYRILYGSL